jgi:hypothetical protein
MTTVGEQASGAAILLAIFSAADAAQNAVLEHSNPTRPELEQLADRLANAVVDAGRDWLREQDGEH